MRRSAFLGVIVLLASPRPARAQLRIEDASIAQLSAALASRAISCRDLVAHYLRRIDAYDKRGPAINAIITINPRALTEADSLDEARRAHPRAFGPLHCIPLVVKDNMQTRGLKTTAGSLSFGNWEPRSDAFLVRRIREAGAVILAKTNLAEFAFTPYETVSSALPGYTKNPYALDRVTAGSSGGTAAAVAASFATAGLGTDTGNSIRGPSAHQALVGIRSTMGATSRAGIAPLALGADIAGPMARSVADAAAIFQVVAGADPNDPVTRAADDHPLPDLRASLVADGLRGARLGVLPQAYLTATTDSEVIRVFARARADLARAGATVIDSVLVPELDSLRRLQSGACNTFRADLNGYLSSLGSDAPIADLDAIVKSRAFHPTIEGRLTAGQSAPAVPDTTPGCRSRQAFRAALREAVQRVFDRLRLDALIYPTWSNPPRLIGDLNTPHGDNSQLFSPSTGFPAITVPMGYTRGVLPAGLQLLGRAWSEPTLIRLAYGYEQATRHRRPPPSTPALSRARGSR